MDIERRNISKPKTQNITEFFFCDSIKHWSVLEYKRMKERESRTTTVSPNYRHCHIEKKPIKIKRETFFVSEAKWHVWWWSENGVFLHQYRRNCRRFHWILRRVLGTQVSGEIQRRHRLIHGLWSCNWQFESDQCGISRRVLLLVSSCSCCTWLTPLLHALNNSNFYQAKHILSFYKHAL